MLDGKYTDLDALNTYLKHGNEIHVESADEYIDALEFLGRSGFEVGYHYNHSDRYRYLTMYDGKIHASMNHGSIHGPTVTSTEFSDIHTIIASKVGTINVAELNDLF